MTDDIEAAKALLVRAGYTLTEPSKEYDPREFWHWLDATAARVGWESEGDLKLTSEDQDELVKVFGWECGSCREDVGWCNRANVARDDIGALCIFFECGHCGTDWSYRPTGQDIS